MSATMDKDRYVKDPIHGFISISKLGWAVIDTEQFQRLRYLKQLGTSYYVWPGASHNRFEHCIGVGYLARLLVESIRKTQPELGITNREVACVEIAGLTHDLGHGPLSHVFDGQFIPVARPDFDWTHEKGSENMLDALIKSAPDDDVRALPKADIKLIKALIAGEKSRCPTEKAFLFDIISNKRNGLDVDRFDYILRDDFKTTGTRSILDIQRIFQSARVIEDQICYNIKSCDSIFEICAARFRLHKTIYTHKTARAIEYMIVDALLLADPHLDIAAKVNEPEEYLYLTDDITRDIERSRIPELAPAQEILKNIHNRILYKSVDQLYLPWAVGEFRNNLTPEVIARSIKKAVEADQIPRTIEYKEGDKTAVIDTLNDITAEHIIVDWSCLHHGMKEKDPLEEVRWYCDSNPNKCQRAGPGDISGSKPASYAMWLLRIYTKNLQFQGPIQTGFRDAVATVIPSHLLPIDPNSPDPSTQPVMAKEKKEKTKTLSRSSSVTTIAADEDEAPPTTNGSTGSIVFNKFKTVEPTFVPPSPKRKRRTELDNATRLNGIRDGSPSPTKKSRST